MNNWTAKIKNIRFNDLLQCRISLLLVFFFSIGIPINNPSMWIESPYFWYATALLSIFTYLFSWLFPNRIAILNYSTIGILSLMAAYGVLLCNYHDFTPSYLLGYYSYTILVAAVIRDSKILKGFIFFTASVFTLACLLNPVIGEHRYLLIFFEMVISISGLHALNSKLENYKAVQKIQETTNELATSQVNLDALFNSSKKIVLIIGADDIIKMISQSASQYFKILFGKEARKGESLKSFIESEEKKHFIEFYSFLQEALQGNSVNTIQEINSYHLELTCEPIYQYGQVDRVFVSITDVTEKISLQLETKKSEEKYKSLARNFPDTIIRLDKDAKILFINKIEPYQSEYEILGRGIADYISSVQRDMSQCTDIKKYVNEIFLGDKDTIDWECMYKDSNTGKKGWQWCHLSSEYNNDGEWISAVLIIKDITRLREQEQKIKVSEAQYKDIIQNSQHLICTHDKEGVFLTVNPAFTNILGYEEEEIIGKNVQDFIPGNHREDFKIYLEFILKEKIFNGVMKVVTKDGRIKVLEFKNSLKIDAEKGPIIRGMASDITNNYESGRVKKEFIANVSHELRTPINGILGLIQLLRKTRLSNIQRDRLDSMEQSTKILSNLINDLLQLSKIDANKLNIKPEPFVLKKMLDRLVQSFDIRVEEKGIALKVNLSEDVPTNVFTDKLRINQVLNDLVDNAIKFTDDGEVTIKVSLVNSMGIKHKLKFEIMDSGIGISEQNQEKLFQRFSQVDSRASRRYSGTGLGLAICKEIIGLMNGEIGVVSKLKKGSNFWFTIQVLEFEDELIDSKENVPIKNINKGEIHILLVEDNPINQKVTREILKNYGYQVDVANNGMAGLKKLESKRYDLILLDYQMPNMNGKEFYNRFKRTKHRQEPVILLSANVLEETRDHMLALGVYEYVTKPIDFDKLDILIQQATFRTYHSRKRKKELKQNASDVSDIARINKMQSYLSSIETIDTKTLYNEFYTHSQKLIEELEQLILDEDYTNANIKLHNLKGMSSSMGIQDIYTISNNMMNDINVKKTSYLHEELQNLKQKHSNLKYSTENK